MYYDSGSDKDTMDSVIYKKFYDKSNFRVLDNVMEELLYSKTSKDGNYIRAIEDALTQELVSYENKPADISRNDNELKALNTLTSVLKKENKTLEQTLTQTDKPGAGRRGM